MAKAVVVLSWTVWTLLLIATCIVYVGWGDQAENQPMGRLANVLMILTLTGIIVPLGVSSWKFGMDDEE